MSGLVAPHEAASAMLVAMQSAGLLPRDPGAVHGQLLRGGLVRFPCEGERNPNGWAVLHLDGCPAGAFGNWRLDISGNWRADHGAKASRPDWAAIAARKAEEREAAFARHLEATESAAFLWRLSRPASADHAYLVAKRLSLAVAGLEPNGRSITVQQDGRDLLIPLYDAEGKLWNCQRIMPDCQKRFLARARIDGCFWRAGRATGAPIIAIAEGFATAAAIHLATGLPVAAAMNAGNLMAVALALSCRFPAACLILCADTDAGPAGNLGLDKAKAAAAMVPGALVARPPRPADWPEGKGWDFADTFTEPNGAELIRRALGLHKD